ncbi:hypothetical protein M405DRAFT_864933 [Rhizopogon salebrosus TDB-379]|nr:hypothetical protein M405DRAFT_864933 [Rhizopogon salebrosus TDB-379]
MTIARSLSESLHPLLFQSTPGSSNRLPSSPLRESERQLSTPPIHHSLLRVATTYVRPPPAGQKLSDLGPTHFSFLPSATAESTTSPYSQSSCNAAPSHCLSGAGSSKQWDHSSDLVSYYDKGWI